MRSKAPASVKTKELAEAIGKSPQAVTNILGKLRDKKEVFPAPIYGWWTLTPPSIASVSSLSALSNVKNTELKSLKAHTSLEKAYTPSVSDEETEDTANLELY